MYRDERNLLPLFFRVPVICLHWVVQRLVKGLHYLDLW